MIRRTTAISEDSLQSTHARPACGEYDLRDL
jgi:hypothetical protein